MESVGVRQKPSEDLLTPDREWMMYDKWIYIPQCHIDSEANVACRKDSEMNVSSQKDGQ